jgi:hypothetical protein
MNMKRSTILNNIYGFDFLHPSDDQSIGTVKELIELLIESVAIIQPDKNVSKDDVTKFTSDELGVISEALEHMSGTMPELRSLDASSGVEETHQWVDTWFLEYALS